MCPKKSIFDEDWAEYSLIPIKIPYDIKQMESYKLASFHEGIKKKTHLQEIFIFSEKFKSQCISVLFR